MYLHDKDFLIARISSGKFRFKLNNKRYFLVEPSLDQKYDAQEIFQDQYEEAMDSDLFSEEEVYEHLLESGVWDLSKENHIKALPKEIEEFKIAIYKSGFKPEDKKRIKLAIQQAKAKLAELYQLRHSQDGNSYLGVAELVKNRYLIWCSLHDERGKVYVGDFWNEDTELIDEVMVLVARNKISEENMREVARSHPWQGIWDCNRSGDIFNTSPINYTEEQRLLVGYSLLYQNVREYPDCPPDEVVDDDDALDGFLILKRRERETKLFKASTEELLDNEKIKKADEVFIVTSREGAGKVDMLNDPEAMAIKRKRMAFVKKKGHVQEAEMPDTALKLKTMMNQLNQAK